MPKFPKFTSRMAVAVAAGAVLTGVLATPALAEGRWSSKVGGAAPGFQTHTFKDRNKDNTATTFKQSGGSVASGKFRNVTWQLSERHTYLPDKNRGRKTFGNGTGNWGSRKKDGSHDYRFGLIYINGADWGNQFSAKSVKVTY